MIGGSWQVPTAKDDTQTALQQAWAAAEYCGGGLLAGRGPSAPEDEALALTHMQGQKEPSGALRL